MEVGRSPIPKYRRRSDNYAFVEHSSINTKTHRMTLGRYGSAESKRRYQQFLNDLHVRQSEVIEPGRWLTVDDCVKAYLMHAQNYYSRSYGMSSEYQGVINAMQWLEDVGEMAVAAFGPKTLKEVRARLVADGYVRRTVNHYTARIKRFFAWACEHELAPPELYHKLCCVRGLSRGQENCIESDPIKPAEYNDIVTVLPFVSPAIGAMVQAQYWCGMRSGETCIMRAVDIDRSQTVWLYRPQRHKTQWRGYSAVKAIPPRVQPVIAPFLNNEPFMFLTGGVRVHYTAETYRRALDRGVSKAKRKGVELTRFTPLQIRHGIATRLSQTLGEQAAQTWLGHERLETTGLYVERQEKALIGLANQLDETFPESLNASA